MTATPTLWTSPALSRRRLLTVLGATGLTAALAACSAPEDAAGQDDPTGPVWDAEARQYVMEDAVASGQQPLRIWVEYAAYGDALKAAFQKAHPGAVLDYEVVAKVDALDKMSLAGEAGTGPDVFTTNFDDLAQAVSSSLAAPLGEYGPVIAEQCGQDLSSVVTRDGQVYGVPVSTESIALFYNKTLLKDLTGSDQPARTWEEITSLASTYNDKASNRWTIRFLSGQLYYAYPVLSSAGWHLYPDGDLAHPGLDQQTLTQGLESYKNLRSVWDVNSADATYDFIENEFIKGQTPYVITGPWVFSDFDAAAQEKGFEYGVTTLPTTAGGQKAASLAGMAVGVVSGYSRYPAAARILAAFLASDAGAQALYSSVRAVPALAPDRLGSVPALAPDRLGSVPALADDDKAAGVLAQSANADFVQEIPEYMYTVGNELVAGVWDGVLDVPAAQSKAVTSYDQLRSMVS